jgi:hypothetical protein
MVDIIDLGSGGLGPTRYSVKRHVPLFVAAINDGPCLSFVGAVFVNCFDSRVRHSWTSNDAYESNGAVFSSIVDTPAHFPGQVIGSDTDLVHFPGIQGSQWVTNLREGFI